MLHVEDLARIIAAVETIHVAPVHRHLHGPRRDSDADLSPGPPGREPRGTVALQRMPCASCRPRAHLRDPRDVKALAELVLAHRLLLTPEAQIQGTTQR